MRRHGRIRGHSSRDRRRIPPRRRGGRRPNSEGSRFPVDRPRLHRPCRPRGRAHSRPNRGGCVGPARIRRALVLRHLLRKPALRGGWIPCEAFPTPPVPRRRRSLRIPRGPTFRVGCVPVAGPPRIVFDARNDPCVPTVLSRSDPPWRGRCQGADHPRPARAHVPEHDSVPAHDPRSSCRNVLACDVSLLARRLGGCRGPIPRGAAGPPPPEGGARRSRVPSGAPRIPRAPRSLSSTCMAHGENQRPRRPFPRPLSEARRESRPRSGAAARGGDRPRVGHAADSLHGPAVRRFPPRFFRRERAPRVPPTRRLAPSERNPDISAPLSLFQPWFDGQSGGGTPPPIPNPEVKPAHVPCGSAVREPARSLPSFEEGLGRRPRYASRPSLWWTTNRAVLTAVGPWNAVSHSLFLFAAFRAELQSDDNQGDREHEDHVRELRNRDRCGGAAAYQRVPARSRVVQERPVYELRAGEARVHPRRHRETVGPRGHTREVPVERAAVRPGWRGARSDVVEAVWKRVLDRHRPGRDGPCVVVV